jgi:hypothetical protein
LNRFCSLENDYKQRTGASSSSNRVEKLYTTQVSQVNEHSFQTSLPAGDCEPRAAETAEVAQLRSMFPQKVQRLQNRRFRHRQDYQLRLTPVHLTTVVLTYILLWWIEHLPVKRNNFTLTCCFLKKFLTGEVITPYDYLANCMSANNIPHKSYKMAVAPTRGQYNLQHVVQRICWKDCG